MVSIINYGMGNIRSIQSAFDYLKVKNTVINSPEHIKSSIKLILPGVGSFAKAMENIRKMNLIDSLNEAILALKIPVLGICLGMQLLANSGDEDGPSEGLGYIPGTVKKFAVDSSVKLPHIGFNIVTFVETNNLLFKGLGEKADFYFVHNYRFLCANQKDVASFTTHGETFASSVARENVFGVQFHPEKSQSNGLTVLKNFVSI